MGEVVPTLNCLDSTVINTISLLEELFRFGTTASAQIHFLYIYYHFIIFVRGNPWFLE